MEIVILESLGISDEELNVISKSLTDNGHKLVVYNDGKLDDETLKIRIKDAEILVLANTPLSGEVIDTAEKLKYISVAFTGYNHIDLEKCKEKGIKVSNAAGYSTNSVAEITFGLIISLLRNIVPLETIVRDGGTKNGYRQSDLKGKTLGVLGTGDIGGAVAELGLAFGCKVIAYNRSEKPALISKGVEYKSLDEVLKSSDIVTIHTPLTDETKHLIDKDKLELMKASSFLINTAVGPIVDNDALAEALRNGTIAGAGLDRVDIEPPIPADYPILDAPNVVLLPHIGFATEEAMVRRAKITFENIVK
ncbi:NAD(P)-dependent oxidoreductase, partial [Psychrobacter sp. AOP3-A1-26]|uniref:NAD(P)-dependent oxidoreductase n=1 Tax=Psychrobacter sp. AOP3-A1-26 TaxID=3457700 RepID=UPI0040355C8A